jgi:hypothetical protein
MLTGSDSRGGQDQQSYPAVAKAALCGGLAVVHASAQPSYTAVSVNVTQLQRHESSAPGFHTHAGKVPARADNEAAPIGQ